MSAFKVGEVAVGQNFIDCPEANGMECVIAGPLEYARLRYFDGTSEYAFAHKVIWADGFHDCQPPKRLRKRRPPSTDDAVSRQAMLDCIERAKRGVEIPA